MPSSARRAGRAVAGIALVVSLLVLALSSCSGSGGGAVADQSARMVASGNTMNERLPAKASTTRLVDQDGHRLTLRSLRGKTVVMAPLLTLCQETCPMTTVTMRQAAQDLERTDLSGKVVFLEVSVDPDRDTVRRMHAYQKLYGGGLPDWRLATGRPRQVKALWRAIGVSTEKVPGEEKVRDWMTGKLLHHPYDVQHQDLAAVIAPSGHLRWITVGRPDARGKPLPTTMKAFLNDEGRRNYHHPNAGGASSWTSQDVEQAVRWVASRSGGA